MKTLFAGAIALACLALAACQPDQQAAPPPDAAVRDAVPLGTTPADPNNPNPPPHPPEDPPVIEEGGQPSSCNPRQNPEAPCVVTP